MPAYLTMMTLFATLLAALFALPATGQAQQLQEGSHRESLQASQEEKCVPGPMFSIDGQFTPSSDRQRILVTRRPFFAAKGGNGSPLRNIPACRYEVSFGTWNSIAHRFIDTLIWQGDGPGLLFSDGYWRPQLLERHLEIKLVHLLPGPLSQVLIGYGDDLADHGYSDIQVLAANSKFGNFTNLLTVGVHGLLDYRVEDGKLLLTGTYFRPGACWACAAKRTISLHFDQDVKGLALDNPSSEAVDFFKSIEQNPRRPD